MTKWIQDTACSPFIFEEAGLCLQFTKRAFGIITPGTNAWDEWNATKNKHRDRNFPKGMSVPIFFDWSGNVLWNDGVTRFGRYGHAAVKHKDGKIYSSPLSGRGRAWFNTIGELEAAFGGGMKYVGWTEDIASKRIIEEEEMTKFITAGEAAVYYRAFYGTPVSDWAKRNAIGKMTRAQLTDNLRKSETMAARKVQAANGTLDVVSYLPSELRSLYKSPTRAGFTQVTEPLFRKDTK